MRGSGVLASVCILSLLVVIAAGAWAGDGVVALQTAAASCADPTNPERYVHCGNGTVTDNETGLVWLANANCFGSWNWFEAMAAVAGLSDLPDDGDACASLTPAQCDCGLSDGSSPGEWRLPSVEEWEAMVADADVLGCSPTITNDAGNDCWDQLCVVRGACSFYGVQSSRYWSSSPYVPTPAIAFHVDLVDGNAGLAYGETVDAYVWPVRGGQ